MNTNAIGSFFPFPFPSPAILESNCKPEIRIYLGGMFSLALFAVMLCTSHVHRIPRLFHLANHRPNISVSQTLNTIRIGQCFVSPFWHVTGGFITIHGTGNMILFLMVAA
ncbi:hypothetical protein IW261DRAFT_842234 [Armillaria novae-zelandiae]|uniref:Uncharacterized protein n=1 Tax=Armillaria novae-zelandiae TaxID=153914 RepID=A0AA39PJV5_9AGAR|nr:hypothetical protein IW261DRAFT_842234 [Armillaria novae-zelandiae]